NPALLSGVGFPANTTVTLPNAVIRQPSPVATPPATSVNFNPVSQVQTLANSLAVPGGAVYNQAQRQETGQIQSLSLTVGSPGTPANYTRNANGFDTADLLYPLTLHTVVGTSFLVNLSNPSSGGVVGRQKMSEDSNPMPRDRVIYNYDYFNNTALT